MIQPSSWDVYLVTDRGASRGRSTRQIVEAALRGGVSAVQLREKDMETRAFFEEGLQIRDLLRSAGVPLIVNDRIDVVLALDADGVHLGQNDMPIEIARAILGPDKIIGLSVEDTAQISACPLRCADYLGVSPVFLTSTKSELTRCWGLEGLALARSLTTLPLVAIGSIKQDNARAVIQAGADCAAVVTAIASADDPEEATRILVSEVRAGKELRARSLPKP